MSRIQWCKCQMMSKEDVGNNTWTCTAHLAEGLVHQCRQNPKTVYVNDDGWYRLDVCPDFDPPGYDCNKVDRHDHPKRK